MRELEENRFYFLSAVWPTIGDKVCIEVGENVGFFGNLQNYVKPPPVI